MFALAASRPRPMLFNPSQPEQKNLWGWKHASWRSGGWGWNERYNVSKCYLCVPAWNALHVQELTSVWLCQVFVHYFCSETDNVEKQFTLFGHPLHRIRWNPGTPTIIWPTYSAWNCIRCVGQILNLLWANEDHGGAINLHQSPITTSSHCTLMHDSSSKRWSFRMRNTFP